MKVSRVELLTYAIMGALAVGLVVTMLVPLSVRQTWGNQPLIQFDKGDKSSCVFVGQTRDTTRHAGCSPVMDRDPGSPFATPHV